MPFCRLYIIVTYRNGRGFAETGKKVKKKNLHEREENGGQHVARSGRQALGREKTGKTDCCGQRHHGASLTRSPGRQYLRLNHCFQKLRAGISASRLDVYRTPIDSDFEVIAKYLWNMVLCEALYPGLHTLEIALRNTVRQAAIGRYHNEHWFEPPTSPLDPRGQASVATAKSELTKVGKALEPDRIVSELTFGF